MQTNNQIVESSEAAGFSLIETIIAMFVVTIAMLGALQAINYTIVYNYGNSRRAQNIAILQQEVERLRAAKFTPTGIDSAALPTGGLCRADDQRDISGGVKAPCLINSLNGGTFEVSTKVDNDPTNGADTFDTAPADPPAADHTRVKEITVEVKLAGKHPGWMTATPARVVLRRAIGN